MPGNDNIIFYNTINGKAGVKRYAPDGAVWMNQNQMKRSASPLLGKRTGP